MAKKITTQRRQKAPDPMELYATEGEAHMNQFNDPAEGDGGEKTPKEPSVADLLAQIGALNARLDQSERASVATIARVEAKVPQAPSGPDFSNLPDAVTEPEKYAQEVYARVQKNAEAVRQYEKDQQAYSQTQNAGRDDLWADFVVLNEDLAEHDDVVEFAAKRVLDRAAKRGIDTQRYMTVMRDKFMDDVAKESRSFLKKAAPTKTETDEDEEATRTQGIFGGPDGGSRRSRQDPKAGDMIKELQDMQKASGYY